MFAAVGMAGMSRPLGSFTEWQLAQASTPRSVLVDLVRRATSSEIVRADRILEGYSNEVYRVQCDDAHDVVIRILRFDDDVTTAAAEGEATAIDRARAAGVPVPQILMLDTVQVDGRAFPVMVQNAVPGRPLGEVIDRLSKQQRDGVLTEIGGLMARINANPADSDLDWSTAMSADLANRSAGRDMILAGGGFSAAEFERMLDLMEGYIRDFPCEQWVLCHGDLSLKHIFVTDYGQDSAVVRVSGIIDFGDWQPGPPVHDLAVLRVREPQLDLPPILSGYGVPDGATFRRQLDLHTLIIAMGALAFGLRENDQVSIVRSGHQVRTVVGDLDGRSAR